jgi:hypothetical protein
LTTQNLKIGGFGGFSGALILCAYDPSGGGTNPAQKLGFYDVLGSPDAINMTALQSSYALRITFSASRKQRIHIHIKYHPNQAPQASGEELPEDESEKEGKCQPVEFDAASGEE